MHIDTDILTRELTRVGLKPTVERANGSRVRIGWELDGGKRDWIITTTDSDPRAALNARAEIRRKLRASGVYDVEQKKPQATGKPSLATALQLPQPVTPVPERIAQLEATADTLLDMLAELSSAAAPDRYSEGFHAGWHAHEAATLKALSGMAPAVTKRPAVQAPPTAAVLDAPSLHPLEPKLKKLLREKPVFDPRESWIMRFMSFTEYRSAKAISEESKRSPMSTAVMLSGLKKKGLVQHDIKRGWRKSPKAA